MSTFVGTGTNLDAVSNLGIAATWNGTAQLAVPGNIVLFGHRTTHGAPFRYINEIPYGGLIGMKRSPEPMSSCDPEKKLSHKFFNENFSKYPEASFKESLKD